jgi:HK97 gp10 family phage protein
MDTFTVEIEGKKEFEQTLRNLVQALPNEKVEPVMMEGAKVIADAARSKAPQGPTGNLKRSIKSKFLKQLGNYPRSAAAAVDRKIAPHAHLIEFGTKPRMQKTTGCYTGIGPARPFFRPAVDSNVAKIYTQIKDKLLDTILEAARK